MLKKVYKTSFVRTADHPLPVLIDNSNMTYPIPENLEEITALRNKPINNELVAAAIAGVIQIARAQGQSLDDLTAEVLMDHQLLEPQTRVLLSDILAQAWQKLD